MKLKDFTALTFDCYGTLVNWESGIIAALEPLTRQIEPSPTRDEILEAHAVQESALQAKMPRMLYREILKTVYAQLADQWGVLISESEAITYGDSIGKWPAFEDTVESLRYLSKHYSLFILSNIDNKSFRASNKRLGVDFDGIFTAEDIGSYKPNDQNFEYLIRKLNEDGITKDRVLHTAESLFHDHAPANKHNIRSCWIHRRHGLEGSGATMPQKVRPKYDFRFKSMADLVNAHRAEL